MQVQSLQREVDRLQASLARTKAEAAADCKELKAVKVHPPFAIRVLSAVCLPALISLCLALCWGSTKSPCNVSCCIRTCGSIQVVTSRGENLKSKRSADVAGMGAGRARFGAADAGRGEERCGVLRSCQIDNAASAAGCHPAREELFGGVLSGPWRVLLFPPA